MGRGGREKILPAPRSQKKKKKILVPLRFRQLSWLSELEITRDTMADKPSFLQVRWLRLRANRNPRS